MLTRSGIFHHFSMVNNNLWRDYREFMLEQGLFKFGSQPMSGADDWDLVKFEEWIGKLIEGILLKLLIPWVRKRLNFYYFFISCQTKTYNLVFALLKSSYFHQFLANPSHRKWRKKSWRPKFCDLEYVLCKITNIRVKGSKRRPFIHISRLNIVQRNSYQADEIVMEIEEWKQKFAGN